MQQPVLSGSDRMVGAVLSGRWRLTKLLGEGGMGAVFAADGVRGEGRRAIKVLHPEYIGEEQVLRRFYAEAQASQRLSHPNIARVYEFAQAEDGSPYLVMELLEGIPLAAYVQPGVPHPVQQAAPIVHAILQALAEAHRQGVVHRDLKPDNVFLVREPSGRFIVKVLDFGIAKVMDEAGGMGSKTRTGMLLGTPGYMSPEQVKNAKGVDPRSDLWSAGIILYEMLTGRAAFHAETEFAKLTAVLTQDPVPIEQVSPQLAPWRDFFARALARDPDRRFQSAAEMGEALLAVAKGGSMPVPTAEFSSLAIPNVPPTMPQPHKGVSTHQSVQGAPAASAIAAPSVRVVSAPPPPSLDSTWRDGESPSVAPPRSVAKRSGVAPWVVAVVATVALAIGFAAGFFVGRG
jgi:serine/threonine protein kinase